MSCRTELDFPGLLGGYCSQNEGKQDQGDSLGNLLADVNTDERGRYPGKARKQGKWHIYIAFSQVGDGSRNGRSDNYRKAGAASCK